MYYDAFTQTEMWGRSLALGAADASNKGLARRQSTRWYDAAGKTKNWAKIGQKEAQTPSRRSGMEPKFWHEFMPKPKVTLPKFWPFPVADQSAGAVRPLKPAVFVE